MRALRSRLPALSLSALGAAVLAVLLALTALVPASPVRAQVPDSSRVEVEPWRGAPDRTEQQDPARFRVPERYENARTEMPTVQERVQPPEEPAKLLRYDVETGQETPLDVEEPRESLQQSPRGMSFREGAGRDASGPSTSNFSTLSRVSDYASYPRRVNAKIFSTFPSGATYACSATLVDSRFAMTAGHCIYKDEEGGWADQVEVIPAYNGLSSAVTKPYGSARGTYLYSFDSWVQDGSYSGDVGYIQLDRVVGGLTGYHAFGYNSTDSFYENNTFVNAGYPGSDGYSGDRMYEWSGTFDTVQDYLLYFDQPIPNGMSGSGVHEDRVVLGVASHEYSSVLTTEAGYARITENKFNVILGNIQDNTSAENLAALDVDVGNSTVQDANRIGELSFEVHNPGSQDYNDDLRFEVWASDDQQINNFDTQIHDQTIDFSLSSGATRTVRLFDLVDLSDLPKGSYYLGVRVYDNAASEDDDWASGPYDTAFLQIEEDAPQLRVSTRSLDADFQNQSETVQIGNDGGRTLNWEVRTQTSWLGVGLSSGSESGSVTGSGAATISVAIDENTNATSRSGTITVEDRDAGTTTTIDVTQSGRPEVDVTTDRLAFQPDRDTETFGVSNAGGGTLEWEVTGTPSWIRDVSPSTGTGTETVDVTASENTTESVRSGSFTVASTRTGSEVTVDLFQEARPVLALSTTSLSFSASSGQKTFEIQNDTGGGELKWEIATETDWVSTEPSGQGSGETTVTVTVDENTLGVSRRTDVTVTNRDAGTSKTVDVTQQPPSNDPPTVDDPIADQTVREGETKTVVSDLTTVFSDPNQSDGSLQFSASTGDAGVVTASVDNSADALSITGQTAGSSATVTVTATDDEGASQQTSFQATVDSELDTTPPSAPSAVAGMNVRDHVRLDWDAVGASDLQEYRVYRDTSPFGSSADPSGRTPVGTVAAGTSTFTDDGVQAGQTYYYRLTAADASGNESGFSAEVEAAPEQPVATSEKTVSAGGQVSFGSTGAVLDVSGVSSTGSVVVSRYDSGPSGTDGISETNVGTYRFTVEATDGLAFSSAEVRFGVDVLGGIGDPTRVKVYKRDAVSASFTGLATSVDVNGSLTDVSDDEIYVTVSSFSEFVFASDTEPLPVELSAFDAAVDEESVVLTWTTESESGNAGFRIQRRSADRAPADRAAPASAKSASSSGWTTIGRMEGSGTTSRPQTYRFVDDELGFAADSLAYRLGQVDADGTVTYSDPIAVVRDGVGSVKLLGASPNPARQRATVRYAVPEREDVTLRLYDVLGRRVETLVAGTKQGRNEVQVNVSGLASGVYLLRIRAGGVTKTKRMTVVR